MKAIDFLKNIINESSTTTVSLKAEYGTAQWNAMLKRGIRYYLRNAIGAEICFAQVQSFLPEIAEDLGWDKSESKGSSPRKPKASIDKPNATGISISKSFDDLLVEILMSIDNETDNRRKMKMISRISDLVTTSVLRMSLRLKNTVETVEVEPADEVIEEEEIVDQSETDEPTSQSGDEIPADVEEQVESDGFEKHDNITPENEIKIDEEEIINEPTDDEQSDQDNEDHKDIREELAASVIAMLDATGFASISFGGFDFIKREEWKLGRKKVANLDVETLEDIKASEGLVDASTHDAAIDEYAANLDEVKEEQDETTDETPTEDEETPTESKEETKEDVIKDIEEILRKKDKDGIDLEYKCRFVSAKVTAEATAVFLKKDVLHIHVVCVEGNALGSERNVKASYEFVTLDSLKSIRDEIKEQL